MKAAFLFLYRFDFKQSSGLTHTDIGFEIS
jgi:hypothetical protein